MAEIKIGNLEGAPDWYNTPLDQLHWDWTKDEEKELERYCEKILQNAEEEEMTPMQRFEATWEGKERDRLPIEVSVQVPFATRTLDSWADTLHPADLYRYPKLHVKAWLATAARFKLDIIYVYVITFTETLWGGNAKLGGYAAPQMVGEEPIKTMEDVEAVEVADPYLHAMYPGYLWTIRELRRIMDKYGVSKVMPLNISFCGDPMGSVGLGMVGFGPSMKLPKKNPELFRACMLKATEFSKRFGLACKNVCNPDALYMCSYMGTIPVDMGKGISNEYWMELYGEIGRTVKSPEGGGKPYISHMVGIPGWEVWQPFYVKHGAVGPGSFCGFWSGPEVDPEQTYGFAREHDLTQACTIDDHAMVAGELSKIDELIAARVKEAKKFNKHYLGLGSLDYWTPQPVLDYAMESCKKQGKF